MIVRLLTIALVSGAAAPVAVSAPATAVPPSDIPFELIALVAEPAAINLQPGHPIRVADEPARDGLGELLALGTDGSFADDVVALVDRRFPAALPAGTALLVGVVHTGCFPAASVVLRGEPAGTVTMTGVPDEDEGVACVVALQSVAVVAVADSAVPPGSADGAELVAFGEAAAIELPAPRKGERRFVFALTGCGATTAELVVTPALIDATPEIAPGEPEYECEIAEHYLAAFDVPADAVRPTAVLGVDSLSP